jgi:hypothetical protein
MQRQRILPMRSGRPALPLLLEENAKAEAEVKNQDAQLAERDKNLL